MSIDFFRPAAVRPPLPELGAREICSFDGALANDNQDPGVRQIGPRRSRLSLPAVAFVSGLSAATVVVIVERVLGFGA